MHAGMTMATTQWPNIQKSISKCSVNKNLLMKNRVMIRVLWLGWVVVQDPPKVK